MNRRYIATSLAVTLAAALVGAPNFSSAQTAGGWPTFHGNAARNGLSTTNGPTAATATAIFQLAGAVNSSPVVDSTGTAYVGNDKGTIFALDPVYGRGAGHLGAPRWAFQTKGAIEGAPTLSPDGQTVYVGSDDGYVYALKTTDGTKLWATDFGGPVAGSPVLSSDGSTLYDASVNGTIRAVTASSGAVSYTRNLNGAVRGNLALSTDGSTLYAALTTSQLDGIPVGGNGGTAGITAFYLSGSPVGSPAVDPQGNVYITTAVGTLDSFAASNTTFRAGYPYIIPNRAIAQTTPAIANGLVLFGAANGVFYAVNSSSAQVQWQFQTKGAIESSAAVGAGASGIYFGSDDGTVHDLDANGNVLWTRNVGTSVTSSPAIASDGSLWYGSTGGEVDRIQNLAPPPGLSTPTPGPSATPLPTNTPGPTATATPSPTATQLPMLPLTLSAKKSVAPGKKQLVTFVTAPGAVVHIRVDYPNGDHQSHASTANSSGKASYSFTQGSSKIKHSGFTATITATVGSGSTLNTQKATYTIRFGKIDVSVQPRTIAAKKKLNIYIHSTVGKKVGAFLLFPSGKFVNIPATAGPKGWAHISYKVPTNATRGSKHKVAVIARPLNNPRISSKTTFTIQ